MSQLGEVRKESNIDEDGYETARRPRQIILGQYMPEIFAVEAEALGDSCKEEHSKNVGDSMKRELSKKRFCGSGCLKKSCSHQVCEEGFRSGLKEADSVEAVVQKTLLDSGSVFAL